MSREIKFGPSEDNLQVLVPCKWLIDDIEVTEMQYYGITSETTLNDIGQEPANMAEYQEWQMKKNIIERNNDDIFTF